MSKYYFILFYFIFSLIFSLPGITLLKEDKQEKEKKAAFGSLRLEENWFENLCISSKCLNVVLSSSIH